MPTQGYLGAFYAKAFTKVVEDCEDAWDEQVVSGVTSEIDTGDKKEGAASVKLTMADGAAVGVLASEVVALDLTNHRRITLWIKSSIITASGDLQLLLDEHADCASPLETLSLPALAADTWTAMTLTLATPANLGSIISVGLKQAVDLGVCIIHLDAIKAISSLLSEWDGVMTGAVAFDDPTETDETTEANNATENDMTLLPATPAVGDAYYFGHSGTFDKLKLNIGTQGAGVWTITWKYWDGDSWEPLTHLLDGTDHFRAATGNHEVTFAIPGDWALKTIQSIEAYWIKADVTAYTSITTQPKGHQSWIVGRYEVVGTGDGTVKEFDLDHANVGIDTLIVKLDGVATKDFGITPKGHITFAVAPGNTVVITASYTYWVVENMGGFYNWAYAHTGDVADRTDFSSTGWKQFVALLKGWTGSAEGFWLNEKWLAEVGNLLVVKFYVDEGNTKRYEGFAKITGISISAAVDTLITQPISFQGHGVLAYETT